MISMVIHTWTCYGLSIQGIGMHYVVLRSRLPRSKVQVTYFHKSSICIMRVHVFSLKGEPEVGHPLKSALSGGHWAR